MFSVGTPEEQGRLVTPFYRAQDVTLLFIPALFEIAVVCIHVR